MKGRCVLSREGSPAHCVSFPVGFTPCDLPVKDHCSVWQVGFFWLSAHTHTTFCEQALILLFFLQQPYKWYKIHKGHFFSPPSPESNTGEMLCCSRGRGGLFSSRFTCFSFSRPTKTDKSPKILEANKQEVPAGGISAVLSPFQLVKQSSWVN